MLGRTPRDAGMPDETHTLGEQHFRSDDLLIGLRKRTISSGFVTLAAQGAKFFLNLISIMVLARLLTPGDFGLVAIVTAVLSFLRVLKDGGLATATVQSESLTHAQVSNLFWLNVALSGLLSVTVAASSPVIAWFFHDPRLIDIALLLSLTFVISGLTIQPQALLNRKMRFKALALIEIGAVAASLITGVVLALFGFGYWSLVGASLATEVVGLVLTWTVSSWRPQPPRRDSGTLPMVLFGARLTGGSLLYSISRGVDSVLIGWRYGADSVGLYSRALALLMRPLEQLLAPISSVLLPTLSRLQGEPERYRRVFLQAYESIALAGFVLSGLLLALSQPLTVVLLGPQWEDTAAIFGAFAIAALYLPLAASSTWLFSSQGRGHEYLLMQSILSTLTIVAFVAGLPFGPLGVALSFALSGLLIRLPILYFLAGRRGPVSTNDLWRVFLRHLPVWGVVCGVTWLARLWFEDIRPLPQLLVCAAIGLSGGSCFVWAFAAQRRVAWRCFDAVQDLMQTRDEAKVRAAK